MPAVDAARLRRLGMSVAALCWVGALAVLLVTLFAYPWEGGGYSARRLFYRAALRYALIVLFGLTAGLHLCCLPEFRRSGAFAARLLRAERLQIGGGRPRLDWMTWGAVFLGSLGLMVVWLRQAGVYGSVGPDGNMWAGPLMVACPVLCAAVCMVTGFLAGHGVSLAVHRGGARELLHSTHAAENLGWAATVARQGSGFWASAAAGPVMAGFCIVVAGEASKHGSAAVSAVHFVVWITALLSVQYWAVRCAASEGACCGAVIRFPVLAGVVGGAAGLVAWGAVLGLMAAAAASISESWSGGPKFIHWCLLSLSTALAVWSVGVLCCVLSMWEARGAMGEPFSLRAGRWLTRLGERLLAVGGMSAAGDPDEVWMHVARRRKGGGLPWRRLLLGVAVNAALTVLVLVLAADAGWRSDSGAWAAGMKAVLIGLGAVWVLTACVFGGWFALRRYLRRYRGREVVRSA